MPGIKYRDKINIENVNTQLAKILQDPDSQLLFAVTIYKEQVVGSVNQDLKLSEEQINNLVTLIVGNFKQKDG